MVGPLTYAKATAWQAGTRTPNPALAGEPDGLPVLPQPVRRRRISPRPQDVFIRLTRGVPHTAGFCDWKMTIPQKHLLIGAI